MKQPRCKVCDSTPLRSMIDPLLDEGMSGRGIERALADIGVSIMDETVLRHKSHYKDTSKPPPRTRKRDFAILVRDKAFDEFEAGRLDLGDKDVVPGINAGLKAQSIIDGREKARSKQGNAELAFAIIQMLGGGQAPVPQLDDGLTIEGEYSEVD